MYGYADGDPVRKKDPRGLAPAAGGLAIGAGAVAVIGGLCYVTGACTDFADSMSAAFAAACEEIERCREVRKACHEECNDIYVENPDDLPGTGNQYDQRLRRCISECIKREECSPVPVE